jgi:hypothetical protein
MCGGFICEIGHTTQWLGVADAKGPSRSECLHLMSSAGWNQILIAALGCWVSGSFQRLLRGPAMACAEEYRRSPGNELQGSRVAILAVKWRNLAGCRVELVRSQQTIHLRSLRPHQGGAALNLSREERLDAGGRRVRSVSRDHRSDVLKISKLSSG